MGLIDPLTAMPAQPAPKPPVDLEKWVHEVVQGAKDFISQHQLAGPPQPSNSTQVSTGSLAQGQSAAPPAPTQAVAETTKVTAPVDVKKSGMLDGVFQAWSKVHGRMDELVKRDKGYREAIKEDPTVRDRRPEIKDFYDNYNVNLLALQMEMNDVSFAMEVASKVVEHGTSAAKTAMQTQI